MKKNISKIAIAVSVLAAFVFAVYSCVTMDELQFSANPATAGNEVTITSHVNLNPKTDQNGCFVIGIMFPDIFDPEDITVTYTTSGMMASQGIADVTDSPMTFDASLVEVTTGTPYPTAIYGKYGDVGNVRGGCSYYVFKGEPYYNLKDNENALIDAYVTIKVNTPESNVTFNTAVSATLSDTGFKTDDFGDYWGFSATSTLVVNGAAGDMTDYRELPLYSTVPSEYRYGDFFCIYFTSKVGEKKTELYDMEKVNLVGTAILADDTKVTRNTIDAGTLMKRVDKVTYSKYILPVDFFGLKKGTKIKDLYFYFTNYDGTIVVRPESEPLGYHFTQSEE